MITQVNACVNELTFVLPEIMYLEIVPDQPLTPVIQRASEQPAAGYLARLGSASSRRTQWGAIRLITAVLTRGQGDPLTLPWGELRHQHVAAVRGWLMEYRSPATGRRVMAALTGVLRQAWRLQQMSTDEYMRAIDVPAIRGSAGSVTAGRALSHGEKIAILTACMADASAAGPRNAAIFGLAVFGGLRRAEIAALEIASYDADAGRVAVLGKGNKRRSVYVAPGVDAALSDWFAMRGAWDGPIFLAINKGGNIQAQGISPHAIYAIMQRLGREAGVKVFTPHDLRRTFAGDMLDAGADVVTVQKLLGHSSADTTARYDRREERTMQAAINRLHMPYTPRFP